MSYGSYSRSQSCPQIPGPIPWQVFLVSCHCGRVLPLLCRQDAASLNHNAFLPLAKSQSDIQWSSSSLWRHLIKLQSLYTSTNIVRENNSTPLTFLQIGFVESILFTLPDICFSVNYPTWLFFSSYNLLLAIYP